MGPLFWCVLAPDLGVKKRPPKWGSFCPGSLFFIQTGLVAPELGGHLLTPKTGTSKTIKNCRKCARNGPLPTCFWKPQGGLGDSVKCRAMSYGERLRKPRLLDLGMAVGWVGKPCRRDRWRWAGWVKPCAKNTQVYSRCEASIEEHT